MPYEIITKDLQNSDFILNMGNNAAENHPISFKWALKAQGAQECFCYGVGVFLSDGGVV